MVLITRNKMHFLRKNWKINLGFTIRWRHILDFPSVTTDMRYRDKSGKYRKFGDRGQLCCLKTLKLIIITPTLVAAMETNVRIRHWRSNYHWNQGHGVREMGEEGLSSVFCWTVWSISDHASWDQCLWNFTKSLGYCRKDCLVIYMLFARIRTAVLSDVGKRASCKKQRNAMFWYQHQAWYRYALSHFYFSLQA